MQANAAQALQAPRRFDWKIVAIAVAGVALAALAGYALQREMKANAPAPSAAAAFTAGLAMGVPQSARPLTPEEEAYAAALWPIHTQVKLSAVRMTLAGLNYKIDHHDAAKLKATVRPLTKMFLEAEQRAHQIRPPASLDEAHASYLKAIEHYIGASREMVKIADDGREEHLMAAHRRSGQASHDLLALSDVLWPGEYKPN
jgi:hypothetical protein